MWGPWEESKKTKFPSYKDSTVCLTGINVGTPKDHLLFLLLSPGTPVKQKAKATRLPVATAEEESSSLYSPRFFLSNYLSRNVWNHERASHTGEAVLTQGLLPQVLSSGASLTTLSQPRQTGLLKRCWETCAENSC